MNRQEWWDIERELHPYRTIELVMTVFYRTTYPVRDKWFWLKRWIREFRYQTVCTDCGRKDWMSGHDQCIPF